jgi:hypothetical protein
LKRLAFDVFPNRNVSADELAILAAFDLKHVGLQQTRAIRVRSPQFKQARTARTLRWSPPPARRPG